VATAPESDPFAWDNCDYSLKVECPTCGQHVATVQRWENHEEKRTVHEHEHAWLWASEEDIERAVAKARRRADDRCDYYNGRGVRIRGRRPSDYGA
jgi:hypothetical protein